MGDGVSGGIKAVGKGNFLLLNSFKLYISQILNIYMERRKWGDQRCSSFDKSNYMFHSEYAIKVCQILNIHMQRRKWGDQSCQQRGGRDHSRGEAWGHWRHQ